MMNTILKSNMIITHMKCKRKSSCTDILKELTSMIMELKLTNLVSRLKVRKIKVRLILRMNQITLLEVNRITSPVQSLQGKQD